MFLNIYLIKQNLIKKKCQGSLKTLQRARVEFVGRAFFREVLARNFNLNYLLKQPTVLDLE